MAGVQGGLRPTMTVPPQGDEGCLRSVRGNDYPWARWDGHGIPNSWIGGVNGSD